MIPELRTQRSVKGLEQEARRLVKPRLLPIDHEAELLDIPHLIFEEANHVDDVLGILLHRL